MPTEERINDSRPQCLGPQRFDNRRKRQIACGSRPAPLGYSVSSGGEIGRRDGLKIRFPQRECGFNSRPEH